MPKIRIRRDTSANWESNNPILDKGEVAYDETNKRIKIGDGNTVWTSLPYTPKIGNISAGSGLNDLGSSTTSTSSSIVIAANTATSSSLGVVQPDGSTITVDSNGVISASGSAPDNMVTTDTDQTISASKTFEDSIAVTDGTNGTSIGTGTFNLLSTSTTPSFMVRRYNPSTGFTGFNLATKNGYLRLNDVGTSANYMTTGDLVTGDGLTSTVSAPTKTIAVDKEAVTHYAFPSGSKYETLTLGASGTSYTAPADGWFTLSWSFSGSNDFINGAWYTSVLTVGDSFQSPFTSSSQNLFTSSLVPKGSNYYIYYNNNSSLSRTNVKFYFVYASGVADS